MKWSTKKSIKIQKNKMSVIQVENLRKYFRKVKAVDDISFNVEQGEVLGFLGSNKAGFINRMIKRLI